MQPDLKQYLEIGGAAFPQDYDYHLVFAGSSLFFELVIIWPPAPLSFGVKAGF